MSSPANWRGDYFISLRFSKCFCAIVLLFNINDLHAYGLRKNTAGSFDMPTYLEGDSVFILPCWSPLENIFGGCLLLE